MLASGQRAVALTTGVCLALGLCACAYGNRYDYRIERLPLPVSGSVPLGLAVLDQRWYVVSGKKPPRFVGLRRGGFGNPFDVVTRSGRPLAEDMVQSLQRGLAAGGFDAKLLPLAASDPTLVADFAREQALRRVLVLEVNEWKTDAYATVGLHFDLRVLVFDAAGAVIGQAKTTGVEEIAWAWYPEQIGAAATQAFERKIAELFGKRAVKHALES